MSLASRLKLSFPTTSQLIISLLIAGLGWVSGQALSRIDQDLRIMYTEYTLGAADLAHISADVIRYRNTIIRSLEAENQTTFERITESLPTQRARIQHAVDRYAAAGLRVSRSGRSEEKDIQAVRESLDQYFHVASQTIDLLAQEWRAGSAAEAGEHPTPRGAGAARTSSGGKQGRQPPESLIVRHSRSAGRFRQGWPDNGGVRSGS